MVCAPAGLTLASGRSRVQFPVPTFRSQGHRAPNEKQPTAPTARESALSGEVRTPNRTKQATRCTRSPEQATGRTKTTSRTECSATCSSHASHGPTDRTQTTKESDASGLEVASPERRVPERTTGRTRSEVQPTALQRTGKATRRTPTGRTSLLRPRD